MTYRIITSKEFKTSHWAGGTTCELYLYPPDGDYAARLFHFRISSAVVEQEESTFTSLPGIRRTLMVLSGNLTLKHTGHYSRQLVTYEQDSFSGSWETISQGTCVDLNLMTDESCNGTLEHFCLKEPQSISVKSVPNSSRFLALHPAKGDIFFKASGTFPVVKEGDLACFYPEDGEDIVVSPLTEDCHVIAIRVLHNKKRNDRMNADENFNLDHR